MFSALADTRTQLHLKISCEADGAEPHLSAYRPSHQVTIDTLDPRANCKLLFSHVSEGLTDLPTQLVVQLGACWINPVQEHHASVSHSAFVLELSARHVVGEQRGWHGPS